VDALKIEREIRGLIQQMSRENPLWGAPRIHGKLLMLGIDVAQIDGGPLHE
jgi:putative transposase